MTLRNLKKFIRESINVVLENNRIERMRNSKGVVLQRVRGLSPVKQKRNQDVSEKYFSTDHFVAFDTQPDKGRL